MGHIRALDTQETNTQEDSIEESNYALTSRIPTGIPESGSAKGASTYSSREATQVWRSH